MHNRALHDSLESFVEEAAWQLAAEVAGGAEIPFELIEQGRSTAPLYCYRPLTAAFLADRATELPKLPSHGTARSQLAHLGGMDDYLHRRGVRGVPDGCLRAGRPRAAGLPHRRLDATRPTSSSSPRRFNAAFAELEDAAYEEVALTQVLAPVDGLVIESERVELGGGLSLVRAGALPDAPEELRLDCWATVAAVRIEGHDEVLAQARRPPAPAAVRPAPVGRRRAGRRPERLGAHRHRPLAAHPARRRRPPPLGDCLLEPEEEDPLRAFCALVDRRTPRGGELAWALRRFELGCERPERDRGADGLAARRPRAARRRGPPGLRRLAERLAAICAHVEDRARADGAPAPRDRPRAQRRRRAPASDPEVETLIGTLAGCLRAGAARRALRPPGPGPAPRRRRAADRRATEPPLATA